jgi:hypothetical protein
VYWEGGRMNKKTLNKIYELQTYGSKGFKYTQKRWRIFTFLKSFREKYGFDLQIAHVDGTYTPIIEVLFGKDQYETA